MTDDELSRIRQTLNDALMMVGDPRQNQFAKRGKIEAKLHAATRMIEAAFDRRKSGEGGEDARDAARYRWLRDESANSVLGPFVMSAGPGMYGWIEGERTDALVDAARTEGKGNG